MFPQINPEQTLAWKALFQHFQDHDFDLRTLFKENPNRFEKFSVKRDNYLWDYSKNLVTERTIALLLDLAEETRLKEAIEAMFRGEKINKTEARAVLHTALRDFSDTPIWVDGENIRPEIRKVLEKMKHFSEKIISGTHKGFSGRGITDVVNIGIGGSDLGPQMVCTALSQYKTHLNVHFVSNVDGSHLAKTLESLTPETTLFIIASKTFNTKETMTNAYSAKQWFLKSAQGKDIEKHFVALSSNIEAAKKFGICETQIFEFKDWVGGRYSLWSAIGLSITLAVGYSHFEMLLRGAYDTDLHFRNAPFNENIPVLMGLLGIWYRNFCGSTSYAILPYTQHLEKFPVYLQQTDMESNGKCVDRNGLLVSYDTGPLIWGEPGTNGQHAFFQLLHQGTEMIPSDFIAFSKSCLPAYEEHQEILLANFFAQTEALAFGKSKEEVEKELKAQGYSENSIKFLTHYKTFSGNVPTNSLLFEKLTPFALGQLIALYEHKIFVQGVVWNIFSFDQYGVELGKSLAERILSELKDDKEITSHDTSTNGLINYYKYIKNNGKKK